MTADGFDQREGPFARCVAAMKRRPCREPKENEGTKKAASAAFLFYPCRARQRRASSNRASINTLFPWVYRCLSWGNRAASSPLRAL